MLWSEMTNRISEMLRMAGERRRERQTAQKVLKHWSATCIRSQVCVRQHCIVRLHLVACRDEATRRWRHNVLGSCWGVLRAYADQHRRLAQLVESHKLRPVQSEENIVAENDVVPLVSLARQTPAQRLASCLEAHSALSEGSGVKGVTVTVLEDIPEETLDSQEVDEIPLSLSLFPGGEDDLGALLRTWGVEDARAALEANGFTSVQRMRDVFEVDDLPELGLPLATRKILARLLMSWADEKEAEQDALLTQKVAGRLDLRTDLASQEEADAATAEEARQSAPPASDSHVHGRGDEFQNDTETERGRGAGCHTFTHILIHTHTHTHTHL